MSGTECEVCGTTDCPEDGWIYKSGDVRPKKIVDSELTWEPKEGAKAYCSIDCSLQADNE